MWLAAALVADRFIESLAAKALSRSFSSLLLVAIFGSESKQTNLVKIVRGSPALGAFPLWQIAQFGPIALCRAEDVGPITMSRAATAQESGTSWKSDESFSVFSRCSTTGIPESCGFVIKWNAMLNDVFSRDFKKGISGSRLQGRF